MMDLGKLIVALYKNNHDLLMFSSPEEEPPVPTA
jgi:hypothetical protein